MTSATRADIDSALKELGAVLIAWATTTEEPPADSPLAPMYKRALILAGCLADKSTTH